MSAERDNVLAPRPPADATPTGRWSAPLVAPLLRRRPVSVALAVAGVAQVAAALWNVPGLPCPLLHGLGVPCPGCGASRACAALLRGDYHRWLVLHAMAPLFLLALLLFAAAAVLPTRPRDRLARWVERVERRSGLANLLLLGLFIYWLARVLYAPRAFVLLMRG